MENAAGNRAFWSIETDQLLEQLGTSAQGLTLSEAKQRLTRASHLKPHRTSAWSLLWDQFKSPIILLLFCSAVLSLTLLEDATNGLIIVFILVASGLLSFWQELSAADAVATLMGMIETKVTAIRQGQDREVPLDAVVPGDVVRLRAGDLIPGDCRLLTARDLYLNEAVLTGESFPAEKSCGVLPEPTPLGRRVNSVFLGTNVISGFATGVVARTGPETEFGKISERLEHRQPETGFERGLRHFGQLLVKVVLTITVVVFAVKVGWQRKEIVESLIVGLALAVGMTPQLSPAITSVVLAAGAKAMAEHQVIVKQLRSIENLGSMTVLCSDKTGTLTDGVVQLQDTLDLAGRSSEFVARYACLNAFFQTGFANPIDRAILERGEFDTSGVEKLDEIPYDFHRKRLSVRVAENGQKLLITKGALAQVLQLLHAGQYLQWRTRGPCRAAGGYRPPFCRDEQRGIAAPPLYIRGETQRIRDSMVLCWLQPLEEQISKLERTVLTLQPQVPFPLLQIAGSTGHCTVQHHFTAPAVANDLQRVPFTGRLEELLRLGRVAFAVSTKNVHDPLTVFALYFVFAIGPVTPLQTRPQEDATVLPLFQPPDLQLEDEIVELVRGPQPTHALAVFDDPLFRRECTAVYLFPASQILAVKQSDIALGRLVGDQHTGHQHEKTEGGPDTEGIEVLHQWTPLELRRTATLHFRRTSCRSTCHGRCRSSRGTHCSPWHWPTAISAIFP